MHYDGLDTALARRLYESGEVALETLQGALHEVRSSRGSSDLGLGVLLLSRGLLTVAALEAHLAALGAHTARPRAAPPAGLPAGYELVRELGRGGMGVVWEVHQLATGHRGALKQLLVADASETELERFSREARVLAGLNHPGLVRVHAAELEGSEPWFLLELLSGGSLEDRLRRGPLPEAEARRVLAEVAAALAYLHEQGVQHRDLKPDNVLFDDQGRVRLADFGLIRGPGAGLTLTQTGELLGTPAYMAPEQVRDSRAVDARSDVYALGALLYALLTGQPPFVRRTVLLTLDAVLREAPRPPRELNPAAPADLEAACLAALAKDPAERPQDVAAFLAACASGPRSRGGAALALLIGGGVLLALGLAARAAPAGGSPSPSASPTPSAGPTRAPSVSPSPAGSVRPARPPAPYALRSLTRGSAAAWSGERILVLAPGGPVLVDPAGGLEPARGLAAAWGGIALQDLGAFVLGEAGGALGLDWNLPPARVRTWIQDEAGALEELPGFRLQGGGWGGGKLALLDGERGAVHLLAAGRPRRRLEQEFSGGVGLALSADGRTFAVVSQPWAQRRRGRLGDGTCSLWSEDQAGAWTRRWEVAYEPAPRCVALTPQGAVLVGDEAYGVRELGPDGAQTGWNVRTIPRGGESRRLGLAYAVQALACLATGEVLVLSGRHVGTELRWLLQVWTHGEGEPELRYEHEGTGGRRPGVSLDPMGRRAVFCAGGEVFLFERGGE